MKSPGPRGRREGGRLSILTGIAVVAALAGVVILFIALRGQESAPQPPSSAAGRVDAPSSTPPSNAEGGEGSSTTTSEPPQVGAPAYKNTAVAAVALASLLGLSACGSSSDDSAGQAPTSDSATTSSRKDGQEAGATRQERGDKPSSSSASSEPAEATVITIKDYAYDGPSSVSPGAMVMVTNEDAVAHTVTEDDDGAFDVTIQPGAMESFTAPDEPGAYTFHCTFHSNMTATLTVG